MSTPQKIWAYHKYWVMGHSQPHYNALRLLFKGNAWSEEKALEMNRLLQEAGTLIPTPATRRTAYQHIWGYFKKRATEDEREAYKSLVMADQTLGDLEQFLLTMIDRYQPPYLVRSKFYEDRGL